MADKRARPRIQHIDPGKWEVRYQLNLRSSLNMGDKKAFIPIGKQPLDRLVRFFQLARAKWSPRDLRAACGEKLDAGTVDEETVRILEDNRILRALKVKKLPLWDMVKQLYVPELMETAEAMNDMEKASYYLGLSGSKNPYINRLREKLLEDMNGYDISLLEAAEKVMYEAGYETALASNEQESLKAFEKVVNAAEVVCEWFGRGKKEGTKRVKKEEVPDEEVQEALEGHLAQRALESMEWKLKGTPSVKVSSRELNWGPMKIIRPPLGQRPIPRKKTLKYKPASEGLFMKYPYRMLTDYKIFENLRKKQGGTLLIDVSSSMSVSAAELDALLDMVPMLTVALYSSEVYKYDEGMLVIVAARERRCSKRELSKYTGYGNVVDGPALRWLAKQEPPRVWISDGIVTGVGDISTPNLAQEAYFFAQEANILRLPDIEKALQWFRKKSVIRKKAS